jgi:hypothetical protein
MAISVRREAFQGLRYRASNTNRSGPVMVDAIPTKRYFRYSGDVFFTAFEI